jgi:hypothetical protein
MIGATALWLLYAWLGSAIVASWVSNRKGYGERPGLATGLLLPVVAVVAWIVWPARPGSRWRVAGVVPTRRAAASRHVAPWAQRRAAPSVRARNPWGDRPM